MLFATNLRNKFPPKVSPTHKTLDIENERTLISEVSIAFIISHLQFFTYSDCPDQIFC